MAYDDGGEQGSSERRAPFLPGGKNCRLETAANWAVVIASPEYGLY
jgi:hypothetical protein